MARGPVNGLTIKATVLLGFASTLGLWVWAGYDFTQRMAEVEREAASINLRYMHAQELLASVRPQVLIGSVLMRNALLDPDPATVSGYRDRLQRALETVDDALRRYVPVLDSPAERERVQRLRRGVDDYRRTMLEVLGLERDGTAAEARMLLGRVIPKRELVIGVTDEVQALNRAAFVQQQAALAGTYRDSQARVWWRLGLSVAASLAIVIFAVAYAGRLENHLTRQREKDAQHARDLQRLSGQLIHAQEEERRSIARELHDEVGQLLLAIKMELEIADRKLDAAGVGGRLKEARAVADAAVHTVRDLSHLLHPSLLDDLGLPAAVEWHLRSFEKRHGIRVALRQDGLAERLGAETEIAAYRIVQEALNNVAKHANASSCVVSLRRSSATMAIIVDDDGQGFDPEARERPEAPRGLGLIGIRERALQLHGTVHIESAEGKGTRIRVELPVQSRPALLAIGDGEAVSG